jgi:hypothetical protein
MNDNQINEDQMTAQDRRNSILKEKINPGAIITPEDISTWAGIPLGTMESDPRLWDITRLKLRGYIESWFYERHDHYTYVKNDGLGLRVIEHGETVDESDRSLGRAMSSIRKSARICSTTSQKTSDPVLKSELSDKATSIKNMVDTTAWQNVRRNLWRGRDAFRRTP